MVSASQENAMMLASLLGIEEGEAAERLNRLIVITAPEDPAGRYWAAEIGALLERTVNVSLAPDPEACVELVIAPAEARTEITKVYAAIDRDKAVVDLVPVIARGPAPHPLFAAVAASPIAAAVLSQAIDSDGLPQMNLPVTIAFSQLGIPHEALNEKIDLTGSVLVGAGAVGHAFLRTLRYVDARGVLPIIDPKRVGDGNSNRCLYLTDDDIRKEKAAALALNAQPDFTAVEFKPFFEEFQSYVEREGMQDTVIVTVDSRRVRRNIQLQAPGRVFDASTTDIRAVVVHSHEQPTECACLGCIYRHIPNENVREQAIADGLGIQLAMVKESLISPAAAALIAARSPGITASQIEGKAYDSLFKQLCGQQALKTPEGRQVLAPFAFVSGLAGALLVVEMLRFKAGLASSNYWQVNPWGAPIALLRKTYPRADDCDFCSKPEFLKFAQEHWQSSPPRSI
jgi:hypothetical protein